jgi:hypothetical protein
MSSIYRISKWLSVYVSLVFYTVLFNGVMNVNRCPWILFRATLRERAIGTQSQTRRRKNGKD